MRGLLKRVKRRLLNIEDGSKTNSDITEMKPTQAPPPPPPPEEEQEPINIEMEGDELGQLHNDKIDHTIIDIREPYELNSGIIEGSIHIPMNSIPNRLEELPEKSAKIVIYCAHGVRSYGVTAWLREQGWEDSWSLSGGLPGAPKELQRR